jgi:hypothetical protein
MVTTYNEPVAFGRYGTARNLNCTGMDFLEDGNQSWTSAPVAELDTQLPFARSDVVMELDATPFVMPDMVSVQTVFIFVGGMFWDTVLSPNTASGLSRSAATSYRIA